MPGVGVEIAAAADGDGAAADAVPADQKAAGQIQVGGMPWLVARCPDQLHLVSLPEIKAVSVWNADDLIAAEGDEIPPIKGDAKARAVCLKQIVPDPRVLFPIQSAASSS